MPVSILDRVADATDLLEKIRRDLSEDISAYPTPIAGCDAQFNHLLDLRYRLNNALQSLAQETHIPTPRVPSPPRTLPKADLNARAENL
jgi:hypothetical protein